MVAAGILLSRILGLVRNRVFAHFFGTSDAADAFNAAFRIPNFLQNLFGEGVLSASFIPVYARLLGREEEEEARRLAGAVFTLLALASAVLVLLGVLATPGTDRADCPGVLRAKARDHHSAGANPLSGRGSAGPVGLVPRSAEQPSPFLSVVHCSRPLEHRDHRHADRLRTLSARLRPGGVLRLGICAG